MKKTNIKHLLFAAATLAAVLIFGATAAYATAQITLTVKNPNPYQGNFSWFVYTEDAGEKITDIATIKNFSNEPVDVSVYAVDAMSSETGSFILSFPEDEQKGIGAWTEVQSKSITIPPYEVMDVPFEISVPADAPPGQYLGGIVIENGQGQTAGAISGQESGTSISVKTRIGSRVYLTIPGEIIEDFQFTEFTAQKEITGATKFYITLENKGNMSYEPELRIDIFDQSGNLYETIEKPLGTVAPLATIKPVVQMEKRPIFGNFTAKAKVVFRCKFAPSNLHGNAHYIDKETTFWAIPWEIILSVLFVIFATLSVVTERKLARRRYFARGEEYNVAPNENLVSIGNSRNVSWRKIARYNKLRPPYIVKQGDKIIIPKIKQKTDAEKTGESPKQ